MQCRWDMAWAGRCKKETTNGDFCEKHQDNCCVCKEKKATRDCDYASQFVCGVPLCDGCQHEHGRYGYGF